MLPLLPRSFLTLTRAFGRCHEPASCQMCETQESSLLKQPEPLGITCERKLQEKFKRQFPATVAAPALVRHVVKSCELDSRCGWRFYSCYPEARRAKRPKTSPPPEGVVDQPLLASSLPWPKPYPVIDYHSHNTLSNESSLDVVTSLYVLVCACMVHQGMHRRLSDHCSAREVRTWLRGFAVSSSALLTSCGHGCLPRVDILSTSFYKLCLLGRVVFRLTHLTCTK